MPETPPHTHCWHILSGISNSAGTFDHLQCCHCGQRAGQSWRYERDPAHGPYAPRVLMKDGDPKIDTKE
jgi:hypothetical protein